MNDQEGEPFNRSTPGEWTRERNGRTIRCPRCRWQFESMRRFQMACPDCGHQWEEESVRAFRTSLAGRSEVVRERLADLILYVGPGLLVMFFLFMFIRILSNGWGRIGHWDTLAVGFVFALLIAFAYLVARSRSYHGQSPTELGEPIQPDLYISRANDPGQTIDNSST